MNETLAYLLLPLMLAVLVFAWLFLIVMKRNKISLAISGFGINFNLEADREAADKRSNT